MISQGVRPWLLLSIAQALFLPLFATKGLPGFDFWWWMTANAVVLVGSAFALDKRYVQFVIDDLHHKTIAKIALGLASAVILYFVFAAGNFVSQMLPFAKSGVAGVYTLKHGVPVVRIAFLMALVIGPGEELLWRGYFQRVFGTTYGAFGGLVIATAFYTAMHITSMNIMLVVAAGICGGFWGLLYLRYRSVLLNVVSHTVWDIAVFLLFPFS